MEKGVTSFMIPNCVATGFQVSPNPLGVARSPRQELGWVITGVMCTVQQMTLAGLRTEKMGYCEKH